MKKLDISLFKLYSEYRNIRRDPEDGFSTFIERYESLRTEVEKNIYRRFSALHVQILDLLTACNIANDDVESILSELENESAATSLCNLYDNVKESLEEIAGEYEGLTFTKEEVEDDEYEEEEKLIFSDEGDNVVIRFRQEDEEELTIVETEFEDDYFDMAVPEDNDYNDWPGPEQKFPGKVQRPFEKKQSVLSSSKFPKLPTAFEELCKNQSKLRTFATQLKRFFYPHKNNDYSADFPLWTSFEAPVSEFTQTAKEVLKVGSIEGPTFCLESVLPWRSFYGFTGQFSNGPKVSTSIGFTNILKLLVQVAALYSGVNLEDADAISEEQELVKNPKIVMKRKTKQIKNEDDRVESGFPKLPMAFDELCKNQAKLRTFASRVKKHFYPFTKIGYSKDFPLWTSYEAPVSEFTQTAKDVLRAGNIEGQTFCLESVLPWSSFYGFRGQFSNGPKVSTRIGFTNILKLLVQVAAVYSGVNLEGADAVSEEQESDKKPKLEKEKNIKKLKDEDDKFELEDGDIEMDRDMFEAEDDDWPVKEPSKNVDSASTSEFPKLPMAFDELCKNQTKLRTFATRVKRHFYPFTHIGYSADFPLWTSYKAPVSEFTQTAKDVLRAGNIEGPTFCLESVLPWSSFFGFQGQFSNGPKVSTSIGFTNILKLLVQVAALYSGVNLEDPNVISDEDQDPGLKPKLERKKVIRYFKNDVGKFSCPSCDKDFPTVSHLRHHVNTNHEARVNCHICGKTYPRYTLSSHIKRVHGNPRLKELSPCPKCGKILANDTLRHHHMCEKDPNKLYSCDFCDFTTYYKGTLRGHWERIHNPDTVSCEICGNQYRSAESLKQHIKQVHDSGDLKCHLCDFKAKRKEYLDSHIRSFHEAAKSFLCSMCSFETDNQQDLLNHMQLTHGQPDPSPKKEAPETLIKCDSCDRQFNSRKSWRVHNKSVHLGIRYQCEYENCTFSSTQRGQVKRHVELKHFDIRLKCDHCEKSFCGDSTLRDHKARKHPDKLKFYSCHLCSYRTEHKKLLQRHLTGKYGKHN